MKGELVVIDDVCSGEDFSLGYSFNDFTLNVYVDEEETLEKQLQNKKLFDDCMKDYLEFCKSMNFYNLKEQEQIQYIDNHFDHIFDDVEYVRLCLSKIDNLEFIKKNPMILSKKIVLSDCLEITDSIKLLELLQQYRGLEDRIYIPLSGNSQYVSLVDCYRTMEKIEKQALDIKKLGFSPMESIMYVYDLVRSRIYTEEDLGESYLKSRDLSEVMFGDKIVCVGYANLFQAYLNSLGIQSFLVPLTNINDSNGHVRNVVYVQDEKYNIDGVYYFDPTWDSKYSKDDPSYFSRYTYFAKTRNFMDEDDSYSFSDQLIPFCSLEMVSNVKEILKSGHYDKLEPYYESLNHMSRIVTNSSLLSLIHIRLDSPFYGKFDAEEVCKKLDLVFAKFQKELSAEVMLNLFHNVRKIEYYQDSLQYPYSLSEIFHTCFSSQWEFEHSYLSAEERLFYTLWGDEKLLLEELKKYGIESDLFINHERVLFSKVLRRAYEKKLK